MMPGGVRDGNDVCGQTLVGKTYSQLGGTSLDVWRMRYVVWVRSARQSIRGQSQVSRYE